MCVSGAAVSGAAACKHQHDDGGLIHQLFILFMNELQATNQHILHRQQGRTAPPQGSSSTFKEGIKRLTALFFLSLIM